MKFVLALLSAGSLLVVSAPAFAGQVGTSATNSYYRESVRGERQSTGYSQSQEQVSGYARSQAIKVEFGGNPGFQGAASLGINNNGAAGSCAISARVDPYCAASITDSTTNFHKQTNSGSHFTEKATFVGEANSHTVSTGATF
jgi:hypothetical protein